MGTNVPQLVLHPEPPFFLGYIGIESFQKVFLGLQATYVALNMGSIRNIHSTDIIIKNPLHLPACVLLFALDKVQICSEVSK